MCVGRLRSRPAKYRDFLGMVPHSLVYHRLARGEWLSKNHIFSSSWNRMQSCACIIHYTITHTNCMTKHTSNGHSQTSHWGILNPHNCYHLHVGTADIKTTQLLRVIRFLHYNDTSYILHRSLVTTFLHSRKKYLIFTRTNIQCGPYTSTS